MRVFKFGGASIQDAKGVKNVASVLQQIGYDDILIVISAMGKMTNAFEKITDAYFNKTDNLIQYIDEAKAYHHQIITDLFEDNNHKIFQEVENIFLEMTTFMSNTKSKDYNYLYDQIVSTAEFVSTKIVSYYLNHFGIENRWIDIRNYIKTNSDYRDAKVNWKLTEQYITTLISSKKLYLTQGFIAGDTKGNTTTLGREGSDYSAGILAYCLNAKSLTIWKDVEGVLNADPRYFEKTQLLHQISYTEAIELAFYGASVIHPKTLQPLQKKDIPLYVKSYIDPLNNGTTVSREVKITPEIPCFIVKRDQILLSISALDFSFIVEQNISEIFHLLHQHKMKVNLIQNSAISFSVCMDDTYHNFEKLVAQLKDKFKITFHKNLSLHTIRHFKTDAILNIEKNNKVFLKQLNKETVQIVVQ